MSADEQSSSEESLAELEPVTDSQEVEVSGETDIEVPVESGEASTPEVEKEEVKPESIGYAEYERLLAEKQELERQKEDKTKFISEILPKYRTATEEVVKLREAKKTLESSLPAKEDIWTGEDVERYQQAQVMEQQLRKQEVEAVTMHNKAVLDAICPNYSDQIEDIAAELVRQGHPQEQVEIIKANPYGFRSEDLPYVQGIINSVALRKENEALKEKLGTSVTSVKSHIDKVTAAASGDVLSNSMGETRLESPSISGDVTKTLMNMSDKELDELYKKGLANIS